MLFNKKVQSWGMKIIGLYFKRRECLVEFIFWLLSRFVEHSCFPARCLCSPVSSPVSCLCAVRCHGHGNGDHCAPERTTKRLLSVQWAVSDRSWLKHTHAYKRAHHRHKILSRECDTNAEDCHLCGKRRRRIAHSHGSKTQNSSQPSLSYASSSLFPGVSGWVVLPDLNSEYLAP